MPIAVPPRPADLATLTEFYQQGRSDGGKFDDGIEAALQRVLVDPEFVYRSEAEPAGLAAGKSYRVNDLALASRLSFFLWSSVPDDELIDLAAQGKLQGSGRTRETGAADAGGSEVRSADHQFHRPVVGRALAEDQRAGSESVPGFRRQPARGIPARDRAVLRQHRP